MKLTPTPANEKSIKFAGMCAQEIKEVAESILSGKTGRHANPIHNLMLIAELANLIKENP